MGYYIIHHSMKINMELAKLRTIQRLLFGGKHSAHKVSHAGSPGHFRKRYRRWFYKNR